MWKCHQQLILNKFTLKTGTRWSSSWLCSWLRCNGRLCFGCIPRLRHFDGSLEYLSHGLGQDASYLRGFGSVSFAITDEGNQHVALPHPRQRCSAHLLHSHQHEGRCTWPPQISDPAL